MENYSKKLIKYVRNLILSGELKPGGILPSSGELARELDITKEEIGYILNKLEFYGILKTLPQDLVILADFGVKFLETMLDNMLEIESVPDFNSLAEIRIALEVNSAQLAAKRRSPDDIIRISNALNDYRDKIELEERGVEEDLMFHLKIAEASKNSVLQSFSMIILSEMFHYTHESNIPGGDWLRGKLEEHENILEFISLKDSINAGLEMNLHLKYLLEKRESRGC